MEQANLLGFRLIRIEIDSSRNHELIYRSLFNKSMSKVSFEYRILEAWFACNGSKPEASSFVSARRSHQSIAAPLMSCLFD